MLWCETTSAYWYMLDETVAVTAEDNGGKVVEL